MRSIAYYSAVAQLVERSAVNGSLAWKHASAQRGELSGNPTLSCREKVEGDQQPNPERNQGRGSETIPFASL